MARTRPPLGWTLPKPQRPVKRRRYPTVTVIEAEDECPAVSVATTDTWKLPAWSYVCVTRDTPESGVSEVPSPKLKTRLAMGVPSASVDCDASTMTISGVPVGMTCSTTDGARSANGAGVGLAGLLVGWTLGAGLVRVVEAGFTLEVSGNTGAPGVGEGAGSIDGGAVDDATSSAETTLPVRCVV